jgi:uncharacterized ferritin-like protein (DUF455 family)
VNLATAAITVLTTPVPAEKVRLTRAFAADWREGRLDGAGRAAPLDRPARPDHPELRPPREMPARRKGGSPAGRIALLHALAHIELNAIDLAWDIIARFAASEDLPREFCDDWVGVADDEARHFDLLERRLADFDSHYGALPAHDGLWQAARDTAHDLAARLAVVPMALEARGLDVTPATVEALRRHGDDASADILQTIHDEEIGHVGAGCRWFDHICAKRGVDPVTTWQALIRQYFRGGLKPPFNDVSRAKAGMGADFYAPLVPEIHSETTPEIAPEIRDSAGSPDRS